MRKILRYCVALATVLVSGYTAHGQAYVITPSASNAGNPGGVRTAYDYTTTGGSQVWVGAQATQSWSSAYTMPFAFDFYGTAVTKFIVTSNGLLSFDTTAAGTTVAAAIDSNTALPNAGLPDKTIAYFWDDFTGVTSTADYVTVMVEGTAPNRQLWILNYSMKVGSLSYGYWACVLEETTNKIYAVDMNYWYPLTGGAPSSTVGVQINSTTAYQTGASPNMAFNSGGSAITDNEYYEFAFYPAGAVIPPTNVVVSSVQATTATIGYDLGASTAGQIEYGAPGFTQGTGSIVGVTGTSNQLSGLTPNTSYEFYIRGNTGGTYSNWVGPYSFTTTCMIISSYPYTEDFEGSAWAQYTTYDQCWSVTQPGSFKWQVTSGGTTSSSTGPLSDASGSGKYIYTEASSSGGDALLQMPELDLSVLTSPEMTFKYHMYGSTMTNLYIEGSLDTGATWVAIDSLIGQQQAAQSDPWLSRVVNLTPVKSSYTLVRVRGVRSTSFYGDAAVDEFDIHEAPPCPTPTGFAYFNLTPNSVDITFNATGVHGVEWGPTGYTQSTGTVTTAANDTVSLSGLPAGTCLDFYLQSDCSGAGNGLSAWAGPYTICTPCNAATLTYTQDFSSWPLICEDPEAGPSPWQNSGGWAMANYWTLNNTDYIMTMQLVDISVDARVSFLWSHSGTYATSYPDDDLALLARPIDSANYDTIWYGHTGSGTFSSNDGAGTTTPGSGVQEIHLLPSHYTGQTVEFAFNGHSNWGPHAFVDNFVVDPVPACLEPLNFNLVYVNDTSAAITWTADSSATTSNVEWGPAGFTPGTSTIYTGTGDSIFLTGLPPATLIDVYASVNCGPSSMSLNSGPFQFRTACPAYFSAPYMEDFSLTSYGVADASYSFENCYTTNQTAFVLRWESEDAEGVNENNSGTGPYYDHTSFGTAGGGYMFMESSYSGVDAELYSPFVEMSALTTPTLKFWYHMYGATTGTLWVDVNNGSQWITVWSLSGEQQTAGSDPWLEAQVPLSAFVGDTIQVRFRGQRTTSYTSDISIDDVSIVDGGTCSVVAGGFAQNITSSSADLNWSAYTSSNYNIEWGPCGFTPATGSGTVVSNVTPGYSLSGLTPNTCYEFYVTNNCDPNATQYGPFQFRSACVAPLSGTYTIGGTPGATNFADLDTAMAALICGISGPVTYQVVGTQVTTATLNIGAISGVSSTNTFTIDGTGGGGIQIAGVGPVISMQDGAEYINIQNLTITDSSSSGYGIRLYQSAHHINITGNTIIAGPTSTSSASAGIAITNSLTSPSSTGASCEYITIENNDIIGGYFGVTVLGLNTTSHLTGMKVNGNTFTDVYYYPLRIYYYDSVEVKNNVINQPRNTSGYGLYLYYDANMDVEGNKVTTSGTYTVYAVGQNTNVAGGENNWVNNMFINNGSNTVTGIYTSGCNNANYYHNTFSCNGYVWRDYSHTNYDIRNNIFVGGNTAVDFSLAPDSTTDVMDYNLFYNTSGGNIAEFPGACADIVALQAAQSGFNANSVEGDPIFLNSSSDVHLTGALANDVGDASVGVTIDIDGDARPASGAAGVDMGADEYTPLQWDAEMVGIYEPARGGCGDSAVVVSVVVRNLGLNTINSLSVYANVSGDVTASLNTTYTTPIVSTGSDTIVVGTVNTYNGANINVDAYLVLANDGDNSNDTAATKSASYISYEPQALPADTACQGDAMELYALPQTGVIYGWYANQADTAPLAYGDTLSITADTAQTTYYLGYTTSGSDSLETMFTGGNSCGGGNMFDLTANKPLIMEGVVVSTTTSAGTSMNVIVHYIAGTYSGNEGNPTAWTTHENVATVSAGIGNGTRAVFQNPLVLPAGTYGIYVEFAASYTNGSATISNADMSVTMGLGLCGSFSGFNVGRQFNGRILYRSGNSCSQAKIPVTYTVNPTPTASFVATYVNGNGTGLYTFDATGSTGDTYTWDFGNGATATGDTVHNIYTANDSTITVTLVVTNDCGSDTATQVINVEGIGLNELSGVQDIRLFPNPSAGNVNLTIDMAKAQDMTLEIVNLQGQVLYTEALGRVEGEYMWSSDLSNLPRGAYFVRLTGETGVKTLPLSLN